MAEENLKIHLGDYNRPVICNVCGGHMIFKGVGEYQCEKCANLDYDDYGKVRAYIETHPKQSQMAMIEERTGVPRKIIRQMLREERLEVAADSSVFIQCEICKKSIRAGRYCPECAKKVHVREEMERAEKEKRSRNYRDLAIAEKNRKAKSVSTENDSVENEFFTWQFESNKTAREA